MDLITLQRDPAAFRDSIRVETDAGPVRFADICEDWQRADFEAMDPAWRAIGIKRLSTQGASGADSAANAHAWLERPRGHSKTSDLSILVTWALFASRRQLRGVAAAADQDQARLLRHAIERLIGCNPWLGEFLDVQSSKVINPHTRSELEFITSDSRSSFGHLIDFCIMDEVSHWQKRELFDSLLSAAAKKRDCVLVCISNAGWFPSWQWDLREKIKDDPSWYFSRLNGPIASWLEQGRLEAQRRLLPDVAFRRLWLNEWTEGAGDALSIDDVESAVTLRGPAVKSERGWRYVLGVDLGLKRDLSALCLLGKHFGFSEVTERPRKLSVRERVLIEAGLVDEPAPELDERYEEATGKLRLCDVRTWNPKKSKVDLAEIEQAIVALHEEFGCLVACDPWQAEYLRQRLSEQNVPTVAVEFTGPNLRSMAQSVLEAFTERTIELYEHDQLIADLKNLRAVEKSYGLRLESTRGASLAGHGDCATALAISLHAAKQLGHVGPRTLERELICFP